MSDVRDDAPGRKDPAPVPHPGDAEAALQNALQELIESGEKPDADALEEIVARHPELAAELTDFAVEWALQDLLPEADGDEGRSAVPAAMRRFRDRLAELDRAASSDREPAQSFGDPFAGRSPAELKRIGAALSLDKTLVAKLRDRKIVAETVPGELRDGLAGELQVPPAALAAHLARPAVVYAGASFKAVGKPEAGPKESFAVAVRRSFLAAGDKTRWISAEDVAGADPEADPD